MLLDLIDFLNKIITEILGDKTKRELKSSEKRLYNYLMWTKKKTKKIKLEENFTKSTNFWVYKYGEIFECDLGFNPFGEIGGRHYVLIMRDSGKKSPVINVIPLASVKYLEDGTPDLHETEVNIGKLPNVISSSEAKAMIGHIRTLSKVRIDGQFRINDRVDKKKKIKLHNDEMILVSQKLDDLFLYKT